MEPDDEGSHGGNNGGGIIGCSGRRCGRENIGVKEGASGKVKLDAVAINILVQHSLSQNRVFAVVGPALWNDTPPALPSVMLQEISPSSLRSLKTFIFTCLSR